MADLLPMADALALPLPAQVDYIQALEVLARSADHREKARGYADDHPEKFAREILGDIPWTQRQRVFADLVVDSLEGNGKSRYLLAGGHGTGKTHIVRSVAVWIWDALGSRLTPDGQCQGCAIIMTAPVATTVKETIYGALIEAGRRAEARGHLLPGWPARPKERYHGASHVTVNWHEPGWSMEAITPQASASRGLAHAAGGRHHPYRQLLLGEESMGLQEGMLAALYGLSVASNAMLICSTNPTSRIGALYGLVNRDPDGWEVMGFGQVDHPNVTLRDPTLMPGSISHLKLEEALRGPAFTIRGPAESTDLRPGRMGFVYALPTLDMSDEPGPREDGYPGHPRADLVVIEPATAMAAGQHLAGWLKADEAALLFHVSQIRAAMLHHPGVPDRLPDQVGVDCAATRPPVACPRWGPSARVALDAGADPEVIICGAPREVVWTGDGVDAKGRTAAAALVSDYGTGPTGPIYVLDMAFGGELGQALAAIGAKTHRVEFGLPPIAMPMELYGLVLNRRAEMATEAATALHMGMAVVPFHQILLNQMEATGGLVQETGRSGAWKLEKKAVIEARNSGSVDELDTVLLALASIAPVAAEWGSFKPWA